MNVKFALQANFNRYTPEAANALARIAAARARIDAAEIRPAAEDELRVSALAETVHYSTLIEGNELPLVEAERAARGALDPDTKAKIELVNYVDALHYLDDLAERGGIEITPETILTLHKKATTGLGSEKSEQGPPPEEVSKRMAGLCAWVAEREDRLVDFPPPVIAGVAHYALTDIHPFADGNGRAARLLSGATLMRLGFISRRLFSFERYYANDRDAYYAALRSVRAQTFNMNTWLEYFLGGLAEEYERAATRIAQLQAIGLGSNTRIDLNASQERGLLQLNRNPLVEFRRADYEGLAEVGRSTASRDLRDLESKRLIVRRGKGPAARYRLRSSAGPERRGRKRTWTDERIESELLELLEGRDDWPSVDEFRRAGKLALYEAVRRYGGSQTWAERLGGRRKTAPGPIRPGGEAS